MSKTKRGINHLYALRRNRGLLQKHVAVLLGHTHTKMISEYETGMALPPLETALLLELTLGARLPEIYIDLCRRLRSEFLTRAKRLPSALGREIVARVQREDPFHDWNSRPGGSLSG